MLNRCFLSGLVICGLSLACVGALGQQREFRDPYKRPKDFLVPATAASYMKTKQYKQAHETLERDFWSLCEPSEKDQILSQSKESILRALETDKDFWKVANARYWSLKNAPEVIPDLIKLITSQRIVGLEGYFDLIIWERIQSKDLPFYGHGWVVSDDLFSIAGRASWILSQITGQQFNAVSMKSTPEGLRQLSQTWSNWYEKNK